MDPIEALIAELRIESGSTRKLLERVPPASLAWKPHERSRSLGEVAAHVANIPGLFLATLGQDEFDRHDYVSATDTVEGLVATFDRNVARSLEVLSALTEEKLLAPWRYRYGETVVFELPRLVVIRTTALNHMIHHRGQLSVYLRLLDVPLPSVYGPTADEA
ncbi:MAG: DinB family protein [Planctomycetes bacterium]|nr:DinB family protein [Planctomycetota bacterium]